MAPLHRAAGCVTLVAYQSCASCRRLFNIFDTGKQSVVDVVLLLLICSARSVESRSVADVQCQLAMEAAKRLSPVYGFGVAIVSFCAFVCLGALARWLSSSLNIALNDRWKWNNLLVSWTHGVVIGTACIYV